MKLCKRIISLVMCVIISILATTFPSFALSQDEDTTNNQIDEAVSLNINNNNDVVATINPALLDEGEVEFSTSVTAWIGEDGKLYDTIEKASTRAIAQIKYNYSGKYSAYRLYDQSWRVECTVPYLKKVTGDIDYYLDYTNTGNDFFQSDPLAGFSIVYGQIYDYIFPSAYQSPERIEATILWHISLIDGAPSEFIETKDYILKN